MSCSLVRELAARAISSVLRCDIIWKHGLRFSTTFSMQMCSVPRALSSTLAIFLDELMAWIESFGASADLVVCQQSL